jgi:hypothetical protein
MTATFDTLKAVLLDKKTLSNEQVEQAVASSGAMTDDEKMWLEAEKLKLSRTATITMEEYLAASKILDTAPEGSDEYKKAEELVNRYESGH